MQIAAQAVATAPAKAGRLRGYIQTVNPMKKYAFIHSDQGKDYFLHFTAIKGGKESLVKGKLVEFTPVPVAGKNDRAVDAEILA